MIIGNGMIAKAFTDYDADDVVIFASGVSNSLETNEGEFQREERLLSKVINDLNDRLLVYFSTCSVYDPSVNESPYVKHKLKLETIIKDNVVRFNIFRLPQVVGKASSRTLIKVFVDKIQNEEQFDVWIDSYRNMIDIDDVLVTVGHIIENKLFTKEIVNIASPVNTPILEIVNIIEMVLNKRANYAIVKKGANYSVELGHCTEIYNRLGIKFCEGYIKKVIEKYYAHSTVSRGIGTCCSDYGDEHKPMLPHQLVAIESEVERSDNTVVQVTQPLS